MSGASTNTGSNGLQYPVPPLSGSNTRQGYDDPRRRHGQQGHSAKPGSEAIVSPVPTISNTGQYQKPYYQVQAGQNGSTNTNSQQGATGTSNIMPRMGGR
ncbi:hypothetical protein GQ55_6G153800 [Panicum hallii var. hallii]|uniref:Uncharacterized protein n=1 Tax=Panicum hallii var. hallii TaxID=1504633 RepID=A0A2T7D6E1_9POAL|nr:hypothetical protein GQ55_6G153800 [Panicum hallii var. hallii]